jgi:hypothetical protein
MACLCGTMIFHPWTWMCVPGRSPDIHPTTTGYQVIADAYLAKISG